MCFKHLNAASRLQRPFGSTCENVIINIDIQGASSLASVAALLANTKPLLVSANNFWRHFNEKNQDSAQVWSV